MPSEHVAALGQALQTSQAAFNRWAATGEARATTALEEFNKGLRNAQALGDTTGLFPALEAAPDDVRRAQANLKRMVLAPQRELLHRLSEQVDGDTRKATGVKARNSIAVKLADGLGIKARGRRLLIGGTESQLDALGRVRALGSPEQQHKLPDMNKELIRSRYNLPRKTVTALEQLVQVKQEVQAQLKASSTVQGQGLPVDPRQERQRQLGAIKAARLRERLEAIGPTPMPSGPTQALRALIEREIARLDQGAPPAADAKAPRAWVDGHRRADALVSALELSSRIDRDAGILEKGRTLVTEAELQAATDRFKTANTLRGEFVDVASGNSQVGAEFFFMKLDSLAAAQWNLSDGMAPLAKAIEAR